MQQQAAEQYSSLQWEEQMGNLPVGAVLRRTREHFGLSLPDVEAALRIRATLLGALEENRHDLLPGRVYAIGFVRAYSEYLGLDGDKMVHLFKKQSVGGKAKPELSFPVPASESKLPGLWVLGGSGAVMILIVALLLTVGRPETLAMEIPEVPDALKFQAAELAPASPLESAFSGLEPMIDNAEGLEDVAEWQLATSIAVPVVEPEPPVSRITLKIKDNVWIEIRNAQNKAILSRILEPGDAYDVPNEDGLVMDTGNAGAIEMIVDGHEVPPLGRPGDVRRRISLVPEDFLAALIPAAGTQAEDVSVLLE